MKTKRLGKVEQRALAMCQSIVANGHGHFTVDWKKSAMYGYNPSIQWGGGKTCSVSGCGYCKHSTALADTLRFLFPQDSPEHRAIWRTGGAGVSSVKSALSALGWDLQAVGWSDKTDSYIIKKLGE